MTLAELHRLATAGIRDARPLTPINEARTEVARHRLSAANAALDNAALFLADRFAAEFPRFDRAKFLADCGVR
jgi:hypothetical protein